MHALLLAGLDEPEAKRAMSGGRSISGLGAAREAIRAGVRLELYHIVRIALGLLLVLAAGLKGYQLGTEPVIASGIFNSRWFLIALVEFELGFGLWLLTGIRKQGTRKVAIAWFTLLALVSLYKALAGEASCGCFGNWEISPWYSLVLATAAIGALLGARAGLSRDKALANFTVPEFAFCAALFTVPTAMFMARFSAATRAADGAIIGSSGVVVLQPETWVGHPFPLLRHIDMGPELASGDWTLVLIRHDCSKCHALTDDYLRRTEGKMADRARIAFIEITPFASPDDRLTRAGFGTGRLSDSISWFVTTPVVLRISDGDVVDCEGGDDHLGNKFGIVARPVSFSPLMEILSLDRNVSHSDRPDSSKTPQRAPATPALFATPCTSSYL